MRIRFIAALAVASCSTVLMIGLTPALSAQQDGDPCCSIKSINARTMMVTITEKATGYTYEFKANEENDLRDLRPGAAIRLDLKGLARLPGPVSAKSKPGPASPAGGTTSSGTNVGRNEDTKPGSKCYVKTEDKGWVQVPCK